LGADDAYRRLAVNPDIVQQLDPRQVMLVMGYLAEDLRNGPAMLDADPLGSEDEARHVLLGFLASESQVPAGTAAQDVLPEGADVVAIGRAVLTRLLEDPIAAPPLRSLLENVPKEEHLSVDLAMDAAIILSAVVTVLQTRVKIKIDPKGSSFEFVKAGSDAKLILNVIDTIRSLIPAHGSSDLRR
jgi:hypothetical protein